MDFDYVFGSFWSFYVLIRHFLLRFRRQSFLPPSPILFPLFLPLFVTVHLSLSRDHCRENSTNTRTRMQLNFSRHRVAAIVSRLPSLCYCCFAHVARCSIAENVGECLRENRDAGRMQFHSLDYFLIWFPKIANICAVWNLYRRAPHVVSMPTNIFVNIKLFLFFDTIFSVITCINIRTFTLQKY